MNYGYYPGCSLEGISVEYDLSLRNLFRHLEVKVNELHDWICCGTLAAPSLSRLLGLATPLWNIAQAQQQGFDNLVTPCSACLYHFKNAAHQIEADAQLRARVENILELPLTDLPKTVHPLELLTNNGYEKRIRELVRRDLSELKVVCYYGCHITSPSRLMQFDHPENPQSMERLLSWVGVTALDWSGKVDCCGAHFSLVKPEVVVELSSSLFEAALVSGAEAIVVACPMCHANLDTRQEEISAKLFIPLRMPILYFLQVLGYAWGLEQEALGLKKHIINLLPLLHAKCKTRLVLPDTFKTAREVLA